MECFLLFIRERDREDILDLHPDKPTARKALIAYVRRQRDRVGKPQPINDDAAVRTYFKRDGSMYSIAKVRKMPRRSGR